MIASVPTYENTLLLYTYVVKIKKTILKFSRKYYDGF